MYHRYRLGHQWVPEMVLNVQSGFSVNKTAQGFRLFMGSIFWDKQDGIPIYYLKYMEI